MAFGSLVVTGASAASSLLGKSGYLTSYKVPSATEYSVSDSVNTSLAGTQFGYSFEHLEENTKLKSLDLSYNYGHAGDHNELSKFHKLTMYFDKAHGLDQDNKQTSFGPYIITSNLPDGVSYRLGSKWSTPLEWTADAGLNFLVQSFTKHSLKAVASTAQLWEGPEPLKISFTIHAFDDTSDGSSTNIQECLNILGSYMLPDEGASGLYDYAPDGAKLIIKYKDKNGESKKTNSEGRSNRKVTLLIGGMLYIEDMAVTDVQVNYTNTKNMLLHDWTKVKTGGNQRLLPMTADINVTVTTIRGLSRLAYTKMLMLNGSNNNDQHMSGDLELDVTEVQDSINKLI